MFIEKGHQILPHAGSRCGWPVNTAGIYLCFAYELKSWVMRAPANVLTKFVETQNVLLKKQVWKTRQQLSHQQQLKELRKREYVRFLKTLLS